MQIFVRVTKSCGGSDKDDLNEECVLFNQLDQ